MCNTMARCATIQWCCYATAKLHADATSADAITTPQADCCVYFFLVAFYDCCHLTVTTLPDVMHCTSLWWCPGQVFFPNIYTLQRSIWVSCRGKVQIFLFKACWTQQRGPLHPQTLPACLCSIVWYFFYFILAP